MPHGIRFRPPPLDLSNELRWVLRRAFGPVGAPPTPAIDAGSAATMASRLGVGARIVARHGRGAIVAELGTHAAALCDERVLAVGAELAHEQSVHRVATAAVAMATPLAVLKTVALCLTGRSVAGARLAQDVDLLAPRRQASALHAALVARGFVLPEASSAATEQHLPALVDPLGGVVEVHTKLLGVSIDGPESAAFEALEVAALLEPLAGVPGCGVPQGEVLAAHALVHGIAQHGRRPASYPLLWMLADLIDLGFLGGAGDSERLRPLVERSVSPEELAAALELAARLSSDTFGEGRSQLTAGADVLLRHVLAGRLDQRYADAAPLRIFHGRLSDRPRPLLVAVDLTRILFPGRARLRARYGPPGRWGRLGQWLRWVGERLGRLAAALAGRGSAG